MCSATLERVKWLNCLIAHRNLNGNLQLSPDFKMSFQSKKFLLVCTVSVYNFHVSIAVDFNFILTITHLDGPYGPMTKTPEKMIFQGVKYNIFQMF